MATDAEMGVMLPQAEEHRQLPGTRRRCEKDCPLSLRRKGPDSGRLATRTVRE